jgi:hypothetical protein
MASQLGQKAPKNAEALKGHGFSRAAKGREPLGL